MAQTSKNTGNRVSELAKNLKLKNKDILDMLEESGISGKTHSAILETGELSILFAKLTKEHEASDADMKEFWNRKKETPKPVEVKAKETPKPTEKSAVETTPEIKPEVKTESKAEQKPEAKSEPKVEQKPEAKSEPKVEQKPEAKFEPKVEQKPEARFEQKVEQKSEAKSEPKVEQKPEVKSAPLAEQKPETKSAEIPVATPAAKATPAAATSPAPRQDNKAPTERVQFRPNTNTKASFANSGRPQYQNNNNNASRDYQGQRRDFVPRGNTPQQGQSTSGYQNQGDRYGDRRPTQPYNHTQNRDGFRPQGQGQFQNQGTNQGQNRFGGPRPEGGFRRPGEDYSANRGPNNAPRFGNNNFDRPAFGQKSSDRKPANKGGFRPGGGAPKDDDFDSQSVRQPSIRPIYDKDGRARSRYKSEGTGTATSATPSTEVGTQTRLVDIRAREIDLSKYDDKFDRLATETVKVDDDNVEVKIKKSTDRKSSNGGRINRNESAAREVIFAGKSQRGGRVKGKKGRARPENDNIKKFTGPIVLPEQIMISDLAAALKITTGEVIKKLLAMGIGMDAVGANKIVDYDTAYLLADEMGITAEKEVVVTIEEKLFAEEEDTPEELVGRSPVVVVMGHVDHGKTSLLDAIRHSNVTAGEAGGITQHIGAYRVKVGDKKEITFLDTPGHEAFTAMRARGAQVTDIAILVVAADDGIMPQTIEAINHAKAAGISIIVAINKMDKPGANPDAVKQALMTYELIPEEWGGDTICVPVSALKRTGIDELLEMVTLVADMKELKANPNRAAKGIVIEAKLDKGRGPVATVLVQNGTLTAGDIVIAGMATGRVRAMCDDKGSIVKSAGPSVPVEITGLSDVPDAGDEFRAVADERMARELVEKRRNEAKEEEFNANAKVSLDDLFNQINDGVKELAIIIKADVQGSAEAVKSSLEKLSNDEVKVKVIHSGVGGISESDVMLADASNAIVIGFNVRPDKGAMDSAEMRKVDIRTYRVIYECIEEVTAALNGMLDPDFKEVVLGRAEVRQTIHVPGVGTIAGSYVLDGKIQRNAQIRVVRDGVVIFEDKIASLKRFKDDMKEVAAGYECGVGLDRFNDIKENDILEAFIMEEVKREIKVN